MKKPLLYSVITCALLLVLTLTGLYRFGTVKVITSAASTQSLDNYKETLTSLLEDKAENVTFKESDNSLECAFFTQGHRYELSILDSELGYYVYSLSAYSDAKKLHDIYADIDYALLSDITEAIGQNRFTKRDIRAVVSSPFHYLHAPEKELRQQYIRYKTKSYDAVTLVHFSVEKKTEKTFYVSRITIEGKAK